MEERFIRAYFLIFSGNPLNNDIQRWANPMCQVVSMSKNLSLVPNCLDFLLRMVLIAAHSVLLETEMLYQSPKTYSIMPPILCISTGERYKTTTYGSEDGCPPSRVLQPWMRHTIKASSIWRTC